MARVSLSLVPFDEAGNGRTDWALTHCCTYIIDTAWNRFGATTTVPSWILRDKCNGNEIIEERSVGYYSSVTEQTTDTFSATFSATKGWFEFEFKDSYGDGLCCASYGPSGSYYVTMDGDTVAPPNGLW